MRRQLANKTYHNIRFLFRQKLETEARGLLFIRLGALDCDLNLFAGKADNALISLDLGWFNIVKHLTLKAGKNTVNRDDVKRGHL